MCLGCAEDKNFYSYFHISIFKNCSHLKTKFKLNSQSQRTENSESIDENHHEMNAYHPHHENHNVPATVAHTENQNSVTSANDVRHHQPPSLIILKRLH
jgi:hypothetical protein